MERKRASVIGSAFNEPTWAEVQEICGQLEGLFHNDALKDAARLRTLVQKRKDIASTFHSHQSSAQRQLAHLRANLNEWEEKELMAKQRNEQLSKKLQELDAIKRNMSVQLDRFRLNEQDNTTSKESLDVLLDKYDEAKQGLVRFNAEHQNDIPEAKNQMGLYASITGILWEFDGSQIAGSIHVPAKQQIVRFEIGPSTNRFTTANTLWDKIDEAFESIEDDF